MDDPKKELPFQGIYKYAKDGKLTLLTKEISRPKGLALSPDENTLYVSKADMTQAIGISITVLEDRTLSKGNLFHDITPLASIDVGVPDEYLMRVNYSAI